MSKLKIYACSGVGSTDRTYDYWLDNTSTVSNTQAVNTILSKINLLDTELTYRNMSDVEIANVLAQIDYLCVNLYYAQLYAGDDKKLAGALRALDSLKDQFLFDSTDNEERDKHLGLLFEEAEKAILAGAGSGMSEFQKTYILEQNKVGLSEAEQVAVTEALDGAASVGAVVTEQQKKDLANYLNKGAEYFLYLYFTDEQLKQLPYTFRKKRQAQQATYNYCKTIYQQVYGNTEAMDDVIYAGIMREFKGSTPEEICGEIISGKRDGVGMAAGVTVVLSAAEIISIITAVFTLVGTVVGAICACVAQVKEAKYAAVDQAAVAASTPYEDDFAGLYDENGNKLSKEAGSSWLIIAAAVAAFFALNKK